MIFPPALSLCFAAQMVKQQQKPLTMMGKSDIIKIEKYDFCRERQDQKIERR